MADKLSRLIDRCKAGVYVEANVHRDTYTTAKDRIEQIMSRECPPEMDDALVAEMIRIDQIIEVTFYPDTPIGSYSLIGTNLNDLLDEAHGILNIDRGGKE